LLGLLIVDSLTSSGNSLWIFRTEQVLQYIKKKNTEIKKEQDERDNRFVTAIGRVWRVEYDDNIDFCLFNGSWLTSICDGSKDSNHEIV
jgi:hypothetical protein